MFSSSELTAHVFDRIGKYNSRVNAFVTLVEDQAMARARAADEAMAHCKLWGPMHGVPIVMKDDKKTAGIGSLGLQRLPRNERRSPPCCHRQRPTDVSPASAAA
jgi:Asp-tRNA(Asn)/Glu-tRNA(Gln) amidotransferase A subunit family amidase